MQRLVLGAGIVLIMAAIIGPMRSGSAQDAEDAQDAQAPDQAQEAQEPQDVRAPQEDSLLEELIDEECIVHLRFDVLGQRFQRHDLPVLDGVHAAGISITGDLVAYNDRWLVLKIDSHRCWVPRNMVLLMETDKT